MLTYSLASTRIYRVGRVLNDDGRRSDPWALPDWKFAPFPGRFADPANEYRIRYAICVALFEDVHDLLDPNDDPIDPTSTEFCVACAVHHLPTPAQGAAPAQPPEPRS
jgi:hypothetical protein